MAEESIEDSIVPPALPKADMPAVDMICSTMGIAYCVATLPTTVAARVVIPVLLLSAPPEPPESAVSVSFFS